MWVDGGVAFLMVEAFFPFSTKKSATSTTTTITITTTLTTLTTLTILTTPTTLTPFTPLTPVDEENFFLSRHLLSRSPVGFFGSY